MPPPPSADAATSATQLLAFCCRQELGISWGQALALVRNHRQLTRQQAHGAHGARGGFVPIVRWFKLVFVNCKHLAALCAADAADVDLTLSAVSGGLGGSDAPGLLQRGVLGLGAPELCGAVAAGARARS